MRRRWESIPIRLRLAFGFALVMAFVLAGIGTFVYEHTRSDLDRQIERELAARMAGTVAIIRDDGDDLGDPTQDPLDRVDSEGLVQVFSSAGTVVDATSEELRANPLVNGDEVRALIRAGTSADLDSIAGPIRVIAKRTQDDGVRYDVLAGASISDRNQALASLRVLLLIGGPLALVLASLAAYGVAAAALSPVEAMRARAEEISEADPGKRLPVGAADDELARLGSTLNEMLGRLESAIDRERRFVADASHELRTPLAILKAEIELALAAGRRPEELRAALVSSGEEVNRLTRLAGDLLLLARIDDGKLPIRLQDLELQPLAKRLAGGFASETGERRIEVEIPAALTARGDALRIEQALSNLIDNALRYGAGTVTVGAAERDGNVEISVRDEGTGFPEEIRGHATERFARADINGNEGLDRAGSGLGLAIVDSIAAAHGGTLRIGGNADGAEVFLSLPQERRNESLISL